MSAVRKHRFDFEDYLDIEERSPIKHEYYRGELFAMAGAKPEHNHVSGNAYLRGRLALEGKSCVVFNSDQMVYVRNSDLGTYPDVTFVCGPGEFIARRKKPITLVNPIAIVEVLSESTREYDSTVKFELYKRLDSLKDYILIDPDSAFAVVHSRQPDESWLPTEYRGLDMQLSIPSLGIELAMKDLYQNVEFSPPETKSEQSDGE